MDRHGRPGAVVETDSDVKDVLFLDSELLIRKRRHRAPRRAVQPSRTDVHMEVQQAAGQLDALPDTRIVAWRRHFTVEDLEKAPPGDFECALVCAGESTGAPPDLFRALAEPKHVSLATVECAGAMYTLVGLALSGEALPRWAAYGTEMLWRFADGRFHWEGGEGGVSPQSRGVAAALLRVVTVELGGDEAWAEVRAAVANEEAIDRVLEGVDDSSDFRRPEVRAAVA
eukprot:Hpha_TRINITY_DN1733_c0_g1::TRINITY_DN1733_c0_g1_i2::g.158556::m.158556